MLSLKSLENVTYVSGIMYFHIMHKIFGCTEWFGQVTLACSSVPHNYTLEPILYVFAHC